MTTLEKQSLKFRIELTTYVPLLCVVVVFLNLFVLFIYLYIICSIRESYFS